MTWTLDHLRAALAGGPAFLGVVADATLKATVLLLAAALATLLVRRAPAAARHFVWSLAVAGALALPALSALLPSWRVPLLPPVQRPEAIEASRRAELPAPLPRPALLLLEPSPLRRKETRLAPSRPALLQERAPVAYLAVVEERLPVPVKVQAPPLSPAQSAGRALAMLWAVGCALALLKIAIGRARVRLLASRATPVVEPGPLEVLGRLRRQMGIRRRVALLQGGRGTLPMTWGTLRPVVLLPADAHTWTLDRLELVLLHELAHVRRLDSLTQLVALLSRAVYWFHPLVWVAARRMYVLREYACDDHVLNAGTRASSYAGEILEIVRSLRSDPLAPASATLAMARRSQLEGRLMAILDPSLRRRAFGSRTAKAIGAVGLMVLMPLAALQPTAAAQPQEEAPRGPLPRLSTKESERRKSTAVQDATVAPVSPAPAAPVAAPAPAAAAKPAGTAAPAPVPVPLPAPAPAGMPVPPAPPAVAELPTPPAPPVPPDPPAPPAGNDEELVRALERLAGQGALEDAGARRAYLIAADRIRGAELRARALRVLLNRAPIDAETARAVLASAKRVDQEEPLQAVLLTLLRMEESELVQGPLVMEYLRVAERLRSEERLARVLASLLHPEPVAQEGVLRALELASTRLQSDELKHRVLVEVIDHQELDAKVKARAQQLASAVRDRRLQAESLRRLEEACAGDRERRTAVNIHLGRVPFRVDVDAEAFRREAEQAAREAARAGREAAREAQRLAEDAARREAVRERARQQAEEARRRWSAESERLRAEADRIREQARQLNEQARERARQLKEKLSKELTQEELESLDLDGMADFDFEL